MPRLSRRQGPPSGFNPPVFPTFGTIPGLTITRYFGAGTLDVSFYYQVNNNSPTLARSMSGLIFLDGVRHIPFDLGVQLEPARSLPYSIRALLPINEAIHTIEARAMNFSLSGVSIPANSGELVVIELPSWDLETDIL